MFTVDSSVCISHLCLFVTTMYTKKFCFVEESAAQRKMLCLFPPDGRWYSGTILEETAGA